MMSVEEARHRFDRGTGAAKGAETLERLGLIQAVELGGCRGSQLPKSNSLIFEVDLF